MLDNWLVCAGPAAEGDQAQALLLQVPHSPRPLPSRAACRARALGGDGSQVRHGRGLSCPSLALPVVPVRGKATPNSCPTAVRTAVRQSPARPERCWCCVHACKHATACCFAAYLRCPWLSDVPAFSRRVRGRCLSVCASNRCRPRVVSRVVTGGMAGGQPSGSPRSCLPFFKKYPL